MARSSCGARSLRPSGEAKYSCLNSFRARRSMRHEVISLARVRYSWETIDAVVFDFGGGSYFGRLWLEQ